jgi:hypothetical protein
MVTPWELLTAQRELFADVATQLHLGAGHVGVGHRRPGLLADVV